MFSSSGTEKSNILLVNHPEAGNVARLHARITGIMDHIESDVVERRSDLIKLITHQFQVKYHSLLLDEPTW